MRQYDWLICKKIIEQLKYDRSSFNQSLESKTWEKDITYLEHLSALYDWGYVVRNKSEYELTPKGFKLFEIIDSRSLYPEIQGIFRRLDMQIYPDMIDMIIKHIIKDIVSANSKR